VKDETRRKLLKGLAVTLPAAWTRPVVKTVLLPAHAQRSLPPPPVSHTDPCEVVVACAGGSPAITGLPITNISPSDITLINVEFSNPNHSLGEPSLPLVLHPGDCITLIIIDENNTCPDAIDPGVTTVYFDGFAPIEVNIPVSMSGP